MMHYKQALMALLATLVVCGTSWAQDLVKPPQWAPARDHWVQFAEVMVEGKAVHNLTVTFYRQTAPLKNMDASLWKRLLADRVVQTKPEHRIMGLHRGMALIVAENLSYLLILDEHEQIAMFEADFRGKRDPVYMPSLDKNKAWYFRSVEGSKLLLELPGVSLTPSEMEPWKFEAGENNIRR